MTLTSLKLQNFRSYQKASLTFGLGTTLIVGPNTAGKTNILEAICLMATGKSFRADEDRETVCWGEEVGRVSVEVGDMTLELVITQGFVQGKKTPIKKYFINGVARRLIDFVGNLRVVLFWPEHLELVTDSPSLRRKYLDSVLVQVDREYRRNLYSYERGLRQRNKLLDFINEGKAHRTQLLFWDQLLVRTGGYITQKRTAFIEFINEYQLPMNNYQLIYDKSIISEARLAQYKEEEVAVKSTLVGPHRDDMIFVTGDKRYVISSTKERDTSPVASLLSLSSYGSRGEQRLAVLWLKLAEFAFIEQAVGDRPVLLLDDIFSELDRQHRELVLDLLGKQQTIVTSAEEEVVDLLKERKFSVDGIHLPLA